MNEDQPGYGLYYIVRAETNIRLCGTFDVRIFDNVTAALVASERWSHIASERWLPIMVNVYNARYRSFMG